MLRSSAFGRDSRVNLLLGSGHFLSHFYQLCQAMNTGGRQS